jgi:hypothetical protein
MDSLTYLVAWGNAAANAIGGLLLTPLGLLSGWLSVTLTGIAAGVLMLLVYKYTSNQQAIKRVRADIKANLLALKLFKDDVRVVLHAQRALFAGAFRLLALAVVPILVMAWPATMLLAQLGLWYEARPLRVGEETVVTIKLRGEPGAAWPKVKLRSAPGVEVAAGPVRVTSQREVCWRIVAREKGYHTLTFEVDGQTVEKELAVGDGLMRVSQLRPGWDWSEALLNPAEAPFAADGPVQSIEVQYAPRPWWFGVTWTWVAYWFLVSLVAAFVFHRPLGVNL